MLFLTWHQDGLSVRKQKTNTKQAKQATKIMTTELVTKTCKHCAGESTALHGDAVKQLIQKLGGGWQVMNEHHLEKEYTFKNFREALDFTNRVGEIAEKEGHHPDIFLSWGKVGLKIWTHSVGGLSENDFILAAKADSAI